MVSSAKLGCELTTEVPRVAALPFVVLSLVFVCSSLMLDGLKGYSPRLIVVRSLTAVNLTNAAMAFFAYQKDGPGFIDNDN